MLRAADCLRTRLIGLSRRSKRLLQVGADIVLIWIALGWPSWSASGIWARPSHLAVTPGCSLVRRY